VYRWRTLRNAIRNANCTTQWVIKSLNAYCAPTLTCRRMPGRVSLRHQSQNYTQANHLGYEGHLFFPACFLSKKEKNITMNLNVWESVVFFCYTKGKETLFGSLFVWVEQKKNDKPSL